MTNVASLIVSFVIAVVTTPLVIAIYNKRGWIDDPKKTPHVKHTHTIPVPRGGGIVIFVAVLVATLFTLPLSKHVAGVLIGALFITIMGFIDDLRNLHPLARLPLLFLIALIVVSFGIGIAYISNPFGSDVIRLDQPQLTFQFLGTSHTILMLADLFAVVWIVWNMTIVNWSKGLDGQMPGFVGIASVMIGILSLRFVDDPTQGAVTALSLIVAGAFFGFLVWNIEPQRIMAGYGAGTLGGFFLAVLSILSGAKVATALLVLAIPTADAVVVIARRLLAGKNPIWGDRGHLHHLLLDAGWSKTRIAMLYWAATAALGFLALQLNSKQKLFTILMVAALVGGVIVWIKLFTSFSKLPARDNGLKT